MSHKLVAYFHLFSGGTWLDAWEEYIEKLIACKLYDQLDSIKVGLVGGPNSREQAKEIITKYDKVEIINEAVTGFEQETLEALYRDVHSSEDEYYVLYAHTKGSGYRNPINVWWRRDMLRHTIGRWREATGALNDGYEIVGIYWRTMPMLGPKSPVLHPHFSGNFWWAKASYLRTLGPLYKNSRYDAEAWIGYNMDARWLDLYPGAPRIQGPISAVRRLNPKAITGELMTVKVMNRVQGPYGDKLVPGHIVEVFDSPYVQVLLNSGAVVPWRR